MGEKSEAQILAGIESLARRSGRIPLGRAYPLAQADHRRPEESPRRQDASTGRFAAAHAPDRRRPGHPGGGPGLGPGHGGLHHACRASCACSGKGETKARIEFGDGVRAQVWVHPPERFGTALQYATGSKDHNVRLRELALDKGLSLSEHALLRTDGSGEITCATEEQVYAALGLPWIPPELREDRGEVQAAKAGQTAEVDRSR